MKILYIIPNLNIGGAEILLLNLCKEILVNEPQTIIRVLTLTEKGSLYKRFEDSGIMVECANNPRGGFVRNFLFTAACLKRFKPDIVHTHLWMADKCGILAAFFLNIIRISTIHSFELSMSKKELLWNVIVNRISTKTIAVSETVKNLWVSKRRLIADKITIIYNCGGFTPANEISAKSVCSNNARILAVGRITPEKGFLHAVEAINLLHCEFPGITFDIYGPCFDADYSNQIKTSIKKYGLEHKIKMHGPTDDPIKLFLSHDILLMPSYYEGFGMVAIEAMSCGIPIAASRIPVFEEILGNDYTAFLAQTGNAIQIAETIKKLITDQVLYNNLSLKGIERSKAFSKEQTAAEHLKLYSSLIG